MGVQALALGGLALTLFAAGCGSGGGGGTGGPASCLQVQPCGGDVVGTWKLLGGCINSAALTADVMAACPGASVAGDVEISGTATFTDSAYTFDAAETISETQTLPLSCTGLASCTELQARIVADNPDATVTCSGTDTCVCKTTLSIPQTTVSGTYTLSGTTIAQNNGTSTTTNDYCVQGNVLHLMSVNSMGQVMIDDVAQKQ